MLENYYRTLFAGEVANLRSVFSADYWPEATLNAVAGRLAGCVLESLGDVRTRQVTVDQFYVEIRNLVCAGAPGTTTAGRTMADQLLLRREGENFRIVSLDAQDF